jgi:hypothetical protein
LNSIPNSNVTGLVEIMNYTFNIVEMADKLRRESNSNIIMRMVQQTTECAWFIRDSDFVKIGARLRFYEW